MSYRVMFHILHSFTPCTIKTKVQNRSKVFKSLAALNMLSAVHLSEARLVVF